MARGGSRGGSRSPPPRSSNTASRPMQPPPPPRTQVPPQQTTQQSGGMLGGIGSTIMQGMAFGAGSEVAHQAVRSLMGGSSSHGQQQQQEVAQQPQQYSQQQYQNPCQMEITSFSSCLQSNDDVSYCQSYSDMLKQCKKNNNLLWLKEKLIDWFYDAEYQYFIMTTY